MDPLVAIPFIALDGTTIIVWNINDRVTIISKPQLVVSTVGMHG